MHDVNGKEKLQLHRYVMSLHEVYVIDKCITIKFQCILFGAVYVGVHVFKYIALGFHPYLGI